MIKIDYSKQPIGIIYLATFPNGKYYVGQTFHTLEVRANEHKRSQNRYNYPFYKAMKKYGFENIKWEIIDTAETREELDEKEKYYIDLYRSSVYFSNCNGYNVTLGGSGSKVMYTLNETQLKELGKDFNNGMTKKEIKEKYNIEHDYTLNAICAGRIWTEFTKIPKRDFKVWKRGTSLTPEQVDIILENYKNKKSIKEIAQNLSVKDRVVLQIVKGKTWSEYTGIQDESFYEEYKDYGNNLTKKDLEKIGEMKRDKKFYEDVKKIYGNVPDNRIRKIWNGKILYKITKITKDDNFDKGRRIDINKIKEVKNLREQGKTQEEIVKELDISRSTAQRILKGEIWNEITKINKNK